MSFIEIKWNPSAMVPPKNMFVLLEYFAYFFCVAMIVSLACCFVHVVHLVKEVTRQREKLEKHNGTNCS